MPRNTIVVEGTAVILIDIPEDLTDSEARAANKLAELFGVPMAFGYTPDSLFGLGPNNGTLTEMANSLNITRARLLEIAKRLTVYNHHLEGTIKGTGQHIEINTRKG